MGFSVSFCRGIFFSREFIIFFIKKAKRFIKESLLFATTKISVYVHSHIQLDDYNYFIDLKKLIITMTNLYSMAYILL